MRKAPRIKKIHAEPEGFGGIIEYERDPGTGARDDFVRVVNGKRYKYRRARIWVDNAKGVRVRKALYGKNDSELDKKVKRLRSLPPTSINPEKTALGEYIDWWLKTRQSLRPKTAKDYRYNFEKHIRPRIGKAKLSKLSPENFRVLFKELADDGASPRPVQVSFQILHAAFNRLLKDGTLARNPLATVDKPRAPKPQIAIPTLEQARAILNAAEGMRDYPLILVALLSGMRQGEIFALRWADVNLDQDCLWVRQTLTKGSDGKQKLDEPKTKASIRRVDLDPNQISALASLRRDNPTAVYVFTAPQGGLIWKDGFRKRVWLPLLKKAKVPHFKFHELRHFGNSLLAQEGHNLKVLQDRLGHSTMRMTTETYLHLMPGATKQAANALGRIVLNNGLKGDKKGAKKRRPRVPLRK